jgi:Tol biopolymer transport system component
MAIRFPCIRALSLLCVAGLALASCDEPRGPTRPSPSNPTPLPPSAPPPSPPVGPPQPPCGPVLFASNRDGEAAIYVSTEVCTVTRLASGDYPAWSPTTRQIAFHTAPTRIGDDNRRIHVMREDGSGRREVTEGGAPAWSPDDSRIAFDAWTTGSIGAVDADGSLRRMLYRSEYGAFTPAWSPDGQRLAFSVGTYIDVGFGIWTMSADGSSARQLAGLWDSWSPAWSPDGLEIASVSHSGISVTRLQDSNRTIVLDRSARDVTWTADGRLIFTGYLSAGASRPSRIFVAHAGEIRQVVPDATGPARAGYSDWRPVWLK